MEHSSFASELVLIVVIGFFSQWVGWRLRIPSIILFSIAGVICGPLTGVIDFGPESERFVDASVKTALALILFEGGLNLRFFELKKSGPPVRRLVLFGIPIALSLTTFAARYLLQVSWPVAILIGSILVVTGPTVIIPLLRNTRLSPKVGSTLKWEGIINDPIGAMIAVLFFEYFVATDVDLAMADVFSGLVFGTAAAAGMALIAGFSLKYLFDHNWVPEFLKVPLILTLIILIYNVSNLVQEEAGLIGVTLFGIVVGNIGLAIIDELRRFKEYISVFLVSAVFIVLTSKLNLDYFTALTWSSGVFLFAVMFVVRPIAVGVSTFGTNLTWQEKVLISWIAPRGVVAATIAGLFAPQMIEMGYVGAETLIPITFSIIFLTVVLNGFTAGPFAKRLALSAPSKQGVVIVGASNWSTELATQLHRLGASVLLVDSSKHRLQEARFQGVSVFRGEILSERSEEVMDLTQMGYLIAATENDAYNALVCNSYAPEFERNRVFQLPMSPATQKKDTVKRTNRGRFLLSEQFHFDALTAKYFDGWRFREHQYDDDDLDLHEESQIPVAVFRENGRIDFYTSDRQPEPQKGDRILTFEYQPKITAS